MSSGSTQTLLGRGRFATTQWSLVLAAGDRGATGAEEALASLCSLYWYPIFAFVRRQGHGADEAQDLTQGFFTRLIEKGDLGDADRSRGRFRSFLLTACQHFLSNERDREQALKRGGGRVPLSIDVAVAEGRYERALSHSETPEHLYDRQWVAGLGVMLSLWYFLKARVRSELKRKGIARADIVRIMISIPPSRVSFWARPHLAALLAPATPPESGRRSDSPHDQLQSIMRHAAELSGPLRQLGAQAAVAARQVVASIDEADREIAELARNLEPGEEERLVAKIEALAALPGRDDEYAPMRQLLEKQLELIRGLASRIEQARESRNRRVEMLKTLSLHLASLRARAADTPTEVRSLTDRVRTLCDEIARQALPLTMEQMATVDRGAGDPQAHS